MARDSGTEEFVKAVLRVFWGLIVGSIVFALIAIGSCIACIVFGKNIQSVASAIWGGGLILGIGAGIYSGIWAAGSVSRSSPDPRRRNPDEL